MPPKLLDWSSIINPPSSIIIVPKIIVLIGWRFIFSFTSIHKLYFFFKIFLFQIRTEGRLRITVTLISKLPAMDLDRRHAAPEPDMNMSSEQKDRRPQVWWRAAGIVNLKIPPRSMPIFHFSIIIYTPLMHSSWILPLDKIVIHHRTYKVHKEYGKAPYQFIRLAAVGEPLGRPLQAVDQHPEPEDKGC